MFTYSIKVFAVVVMSLQKYIAKIAKNWGLLEALLGTEKSMVAILP